MYIFSMNLFFGRLSMKVISVEIFFLSFLKTINCQIDISSKNFYLFTKYSFRLNAELDLN